MRIAQPNRNCTLISYALGVRLDNGWIQFTQARIPLENMLMKWAQLSPDVRQSRHLNLYLVGTAITMTLATGLIQRSSQPCDGIQYSDR